MVDLFLPLQDPDVQHVPGLEPPTHPAAESRPEADRPAPREILSGPEEVLIEEVLIVEEDRLLSGMVEKVLAAEGYRVRVVRVEGGRAAADASDASPSLLMVERTLPGGRSGEEFLTPWRERFPRARVLLLDWSEAGPVARHEGEPPVLRRPFEPARILSAVEQAIEAAPPVAGEGPGDPTSEGRPH